MRVATVAIGITLFVVVGMASVGAQQPQPPTARGPAPQVVWSPKATKPGDWTPPHKPHTKLADLLAKNKGKANWRVFM